MSYKLAYIADRVGVPSKTLQTEALINAGVLENDIYETIDSCLQSVREGDTIYVYTTALFGRNKLNETFLWAAENDAAGFYSIKNKRFYDCQDNIDGMSVLHDAWEELEQVTKNQMAEVGRQKGGRKRDKSWSMSEKVYKSRNEGMTYTELSEAHGVSESTIRRMYKFEADGSANRENK